LDLCYNPFADKVMAMPHCSKRASDVPGCALAIDNLFRAAGLPENIFRRLMICHKKKVEAAMKHPLLRAVTLRGSGAAGRAVASKAGTKVGRRSTLSQ
jgi:acyl-CoA reductase-like NAD-dependent aldehyde dehydrogenase